MGRESSFDIYSWILSLEIREWLKKKPPLPLLEQAKIVYKAYRSAEDKLQAMTLLLDMAKEEEERECLRQTAAYLQFAVRQMEDEEDRESGRWGGKAIWMARCGDYDYACLWHHDFTDTWLFYSCKEAKKWAREYLDDPSDRCDLQKWTLGEEGPRELLECTLRLVGDQLCVTHAYVDEKQSGLDLPHEIEYDDWLPHRLPFLTGDLVKLEGPVFSETVYGVWCDDPWDHQYNWMGRFKTDGEQKWDAENGYGDSPYTANQMSYYWLGGAYEYCVMDWLRPALEEELPDEQKEIKKIGRELRALRKKRSNREAVERFHEIFGRWSEVKRSMKN